MTIEFRASKILGRMTSYRDVNKGAPVPAALESVALPPGNRLLGVYENTAGSTDDYIAVTDHGLLIVTPTAGAVFVSYQDIVRAPFNKERKEATDSLILETRRGARVALPVRNGEGRFRDVFEFSRFVDRVSAQAHAARPGTNAEKPDA